MDLEAFVAKHGQTGTADLLGVSQGLVWQWLNGKTRITAERALEIEKKTAGAISRYELRPDVFGSSSDSPASANGLGHDDQVDAAA